MSNIVFIPFPETGHLNPTFKIARSLKERGHNVYYLGLLDFEDYVRRQDFEYLPLFESLCPKGFIEEYAVKNNLDNFKAILQRAMTTRQPLNLPRDLSLIMQRVRADLLIIDLLLTDIAYSVEPSGVPFILLNTQLFNPWVEEAEGYRKLSDKTELILCPREFEFPDARRRKGSHYVEASIDLSRGDANFPWERVDERKPLIYCSFGSQSHLIEGSQRFFQTVVDTFAAKPDWQLILSYGSVNIEELRGVPDNAVLVKSVPQLDVLQKASMMITHGGFNSVKECIYFGVPMILFSLIRDQPAISARAVYHGLGVMGDIHEATPEHIQSLIDRVFQDPAFKARLTAMSSIFREYEEASHAVGVIEKVLHSPTTA
ncbi:MAG TPA: glycosyltransferase [Pyrinomonadaceae bacterium]|nr:glycosyltransferase [Pyrinomonadaceae bacterium]